MIIPVEELVQLRRYLHQNPEVSDYEFETSKYVWNYLEKLNPTSIEKVAGHGILAIYDSGQPGKTIMLRCELDALPIQEINDFDHKSKSDGVSHKCGHDGHMTILCGVAHALKNQPVKRGKVALLFQPAEENGHGAVAVVADQIYKDLNPDQVFALHNLPGKPMHEIVIRDGTFNAAVISIIIKLFGKTSHAAEPEKGINPALAIAEILQLSESLTITDTSQDDFRLITPVHVNMGELAYGISAGYGEVHLTLRAWTNSVMRKLMEDVQSRAQEVGVKHHLKVDIDWIEEFHASENDPMSANVVRRAANASGFLLTEMLEGMKWGEDFGLFTEQVPGAMFGLGSGVDTPALHNPDYDFPDELIETGVQMFYSIAKKVCNS